jgi:hypothetical protein
MLVGPVDVGLLGRELRVAHTANLSSSAQAATSAVQNAQRLAQTGIWLTQCGHEWVIVSASGSVRRHRSSLSGSRDCLTPVGTRAHANHVQRA